MVVLRRRRKEKRVIAGEVLYRPVFTRQLRAERYWFSGSSVEPNLLFSLRVGVQPFFEDGERSYTKPISIADSGRQEVNFKFGRNVLSAIQKSLNRNWAIRLPAGMRFDDRLDNEVDRSERIRLARRVRAIYRRRWQ